MCTVIQNIKKLNRKGKKKSYDYRFRKIVPVVYIQGNIIISNSFAGQGRKGGGMDVREFKEGKGRKGLLEWRTLRG